MTENREITSSLQLTETEREIDLKQLLLVIFVRWKLLLLFMVSGLAAGVLYGTLRTAPPAEENIDAAYEQELATYEKAVSDRENWLASYDRWREQSYALLEQGMPSGISAEKTEMEVAYRAVQLLNLLETVKTTKDKVEKAKLPEKPVPGMAAVSAGIDVKRAALIGVAGGLFLGMFALALHEILRGRILSSEELNGRYGLRSIGVLIGNKEPDRILKQFGADHYHLRMSRKEQLEVIVSNLSVYVPDAKAVLLTGSVDHERLKALADELHAGLPDTAFETAPHILSNVASLQRLKDHTRVVLVEQALRSVYRDVDREALLLYDRKLQVAGTITLY